MYKCAILATPQYFTTDIDKNYRTKWMCSWLVSFDCCQVISFRFFLFYFSFSRISSALIPLASSFLTTLSASAFFDSSAALASAFAFFASKEVSSFSAFFSDVFFSFRSAFQSIDICGYGSDLCVQGRDGFLHLCNLRCVVGIGFGTVFATFRSGHKMYTSFLY